MSIQHSSIMKPYHHVFRFVITCFAFIVVGCYTHAVMALPFEIIDARTAALGGTGIVTNARNSAYYNPALLAAVVEDVDAIAIAPAYAKTTLDPDDVESHLDHLNNAVKSGDIASQNDALAKLTDTTYQHSKINSVAFIVPSETVGASAAVTNIEYHSVKPEVGTTLAESTLLHRAIKITEYNINVGSLFDLSDYGLGNMQMGMGVKMMLLKSIGYSEGLSGSGIGFKDSQSQNGSAINLALGIVKEIGVWKIGLAGRNLMNETIEYGHTNEYFHIQPQFRAGVAYQSRRTLFEFDVDLTENEKFGYGESTSYAAAGWEYRILGNTYVRAGLRQNLVGDKNLSGSAGLGIGIWDFNLDIAVVGNADEKGVFANIAIDI